MGLDVIVFKVVMPKDTLDTVEKVSAFEEENGCSFHTVENCPDIIGSKFEVEAPIEYIDFDPLFKKLGLNEDDYSCIASYCGCGRDRFEFLPDSISTESDRKTIEENTIVFEEEVYPTKIVMEKGFFVGKEVGYQRKGANKRFYDDGKWDNNTVVIDRETLLDDWEKYFSDEDDAYYGKNAKQHFKENIIDKFVDGETIVCYW